MKNHLKISIPNPCGENWDNMQPDNCGRFCDSCQKTVTDFTKMSDADFIAHFQNTKKLSCGRFTERQLAIQIPNKSTPLLPFWKMSKYVAASMIAAAGLSGKVFGQQVITPQISNIQNERKDVKKETIPEGQIMISGVIVDQYNEGAIGATVLVQNSDIGTTTDIEGNFKLFIPRTLIKDGFCYLKLNYPGSKEVYKTVNLNYNTPISIILEVDRVTMMGDVIIIKATKWRKFKWWFNDNFL